MYEQSVLICRVTLRSSSAESPSSRARHRSCGSRWRQTSPTVYPLILSSHTYSHTYCTYVHLIYTYSHTYILYIHTSHTYISHMRTSDGVGAPLSSGLHLNAVCGNKADGRCCCVRSGCRPHTAHRRVHSCPLFLLLGKFEYDPEAGARLQNGQHSVACRFVPSMPLNYHAVELRRDFYVHRAVPTLTWPAPPPLG